MTESHTKFVASVPANYDQYLGPLIFHVYAEDIAARTPVPEGGSVLEIAAGTGIGTRFLRDTLPPEVPIVATDLNDDMLKIAREKFSEPENVELRTANAMSLPFEDSSFDAVVCQFGIMFFPHKRDSMLEVARVLKPGGHYLFNVWDTYEHNHLAQVVTQTLARIFPEDPPRFFDVPYGSCNIDEYKAMLGETGFGDVEIAVLPRISECPGARDVAMGYIMGTPVRSEIAQRNPDILDDITDAVEQDIAQAFGHGAVSEKMQAVTFKAHYP